MALVSSLCVSMSCVQVSQPALQVGTGVVSAVPHSVTGPRRMLDFLPISQGQYQGFELLSLPLSRSPPHPPTPSPLGAFKLSCRNCSLKELSSRSSILKSDLNEVALSQQGRGLEPCPSDPGALGPLPSEHR